MAMVRGGKQRGHIPGVGRVLVRRGKDVLDVPVPRCNQQIDMITKTMSSDDSGSGAAGDDESGDDEDVDEDEEDADS
ncbi:hypothetical protein Tco_1381915 [Tanacetum coccineum]